MFAKKSKITFDYIIIGSGFAGSVLAKLLNNSCIIERSTGSPTYKKNILPENNSYVNLISKDYHPRFSNVIGGNSTFWNNRLGILSKKEFSEMKILMKYSKFIYYTKKTLKLLGLQKHYNKLISKTNIEKEKIHLRTKIFNIFNYLKIYKKKKTKIFSGFSPIKFEMHNNNKKINAIIISNLKEEKRIYLNKAIILCAGPFGNVYLIKNLLNKNVISGRYLCDKPQINFYNLSYKLAKKFNKIKVSFLKKNSNYETSFIQKEKNYFMGIHLTVDTNCYTKNTSLFKKLHKSFVEIKNKLLHKIKLKSFYYFYFYFSSGRNKFNNVYLSNSKDLFGLNKININYKIDIENFLIYKMHIEKFLKEKISITLKNFKKKIILGNHPSSCNCMGTNSNNSTVDKNLKIHKYSNIYVLGSDVLKLPGITNPALTIMTLAYRLSDELKRKYKKFS